MTDLKQQSNLTDGKGWKNIKFKDVVHHAKGLATKVTTKVENIVSGIKATPKFIKKSLKKD